MSPEWNAERYLGRPDKVHTYMGTDRNISFDFKVYPKTKQELITLWDKLNFLVGLTYPTIRRGGFTNGFRQIAPYIEMTMGNMFRNTPGYLSSLTLTADETSTWETDDGFQLPKFIQASAEFVYIGNYVPSTTSKHYELDWLQDGGFSIGADGTQTFGVFGTYDPIVHDRPPRHGLDVVWKNQVGITTPDTPTKSSRSDGNRDDWKNYYTEELYDLVSKKFEKECLAFGYDFDGVVKGDKRKIIDTSNIKYRHKDDELEVLEYDSKEVFNLLEKFHHVFQK